MSPTENSLVFHSQSFDPRGPEGFDLEYFKHEISKLKFPEQKVSFVVRT